MSIWIMALTLMTGTAFAFPTWIGVYGAYERHASGNPGTFTVLMNQDYSGLHAQVGVQVNGGAWDTYEMSYDSNVDGNSVWTLTPDTAFPAGSTVQFYFHGYDEWGDSIYDSQNAQNYSFQVAGGGSNLEWGPAESLPDTGSAITSADIAAYNGTLYAVWKVGNYGEDQMVLFSKKAAGAPWQTPLDISGDDYVGFYPHIAVNASGIHVVMNGLYNETVYISSTDGGASWTDDMLVSDGIEISRYATLEVDSQTLYLVYNQFSAPETSRIYLKKKSLSGGAWSAATSIFEYSSYKVTVQIKDLDVDGNNLALITYGQSWYGGFTHYFYHESTDGGSTWTDASPNSSPSAMSMDAGITSFINTDSAAGSMAFRTRSLGGSWGASHLFWDGYGSPLTLQKMGNDMIAIASQNGLIYSRTSQDSGASWDFPEQVIGNNPYFLDCTKDATRLHLLIMQDGWYYTVSSGASSEIPVEWLGNTYHWPVNGELIAGDDLWINIETYPIGAAETVSVGYRVNGGTWQVANMDLNGTQGANDAWHVNMGSFNANDTIQYYVEVVDGQGTSSWDNNNGSDYLAEVGSGGNVQTPVFWGLDPYRGDMEKVRANGRSPNAQSHGIGVFQVGEAITVVARPVENGNGGILQNSVTMESVLTYTTTPGNWDDAVSVTGTFHAASSTGTRPIFDYFSYDLGTFSSGTTLTFWMDAKNVEGTGYAQDVGGDFWLTVEGGSADSDSDGLPDDWELDYWSSIADQNATGNPDNDGPILRPLANIIEWALGLNPKVPNDPMGIRLLWSPAYPQAGDELTLSYFYVNEGNPLFGKPVYAHIGNDNWQNVFDTGALLFNGAVSRFETTITVPNGASELNVVFHDNAGTWDNNSGSDWTIPIQPSAPAESQMASPDEDVEDVAPDANTPEYSTDAPASSPQTMIALAPSYTTSTLQEEPVSSGLSVFTEPAVIAPVEVRRVSAASPSPRKLAPQAPAVVTGLAQSGNHRFTVAQAMGSKVTIILDEEQAGAATIICILLPDDQALELTLVPCNDGTLRTTFRLPARVQDFEYYFIDENDTIYLDEDVLWSVLLGGNGKHTLWVEGELIPVVL